MLTIKYIHTHRNGDSYIELGSASAIWYNKDGAHDTVRSISLEQPNGEVNERSEANGTIAYIMNAEGQTVDIVKFAEN